MRFIRQMDAFRVHLPDEPHKHLGVHMIVLGDFRAENVHVREEMFRRTGSLLSDVILSAPIKEYAFKNWHSLSVQIQCWPSSLDAERALGNQRDVEPCAHAHMVSQKPNARHRCLSVLLNSTDDGRECPSAIEEWTREVFTLYDQCLFLPGEVHQTCLDHGCAALSQLQQMLRISGQIHRATTLLLKCCDCVSMSRDPKFLVHGHLLLSDS